MKRVNTRLKRTSRPSLIAQVICRPRCLLGLAECAQVGGKGSLRRHWRQGGLHPEPRGPRSRVSWFRSRARSPDLPASGSRRSATDSDSAVVAPRTISAVLDGWRLLGDHRSKRADLVALRAASPGSVAYGASGQADATAVLDRQVSRSVTPTWGTAMTLPALPADPCAPHLKGVRRSFVFYGDRRSRE